MYGQRYNSRKAKWETVKLLHPHLRQDINLYNWDIFIYLSIDIYLTQGWQELAAHFKELKYATVVILPCLCLLSFLGLRKIQIILERQ